jgi:hypothetical protein
MVLAWPADQALCHGLPAAQTKAPHSEPYLTKHVSYCPVAACCSFFAVVQTYGTQGLAFGGPVVVIWGWLAVAICSMCVALCLAELVSGRCRCFWRRPQWPALHHMLLRSALHSQPRADCTTGALCWPRQGGARWCAGSQDGEAVRRQSMGRATRGGHTAPGGPYSVRLHGWALAVCAHRLNLLGQVAFTASLELVRTAGSAGAMPAGADGAQMLHVLCAGAHQLHRHAGVAAHTGATWWVGRTSLWA